MTEYGANNLPQFYNITLKHFGSIMTIVTYYDIIIN